MNVSTLVGHWWKRFGNRTTFLVALLVFAGARLGAAQPLTLEVGSGSGTPGGSATFTVSISGTTGLNVAEAQLDVFFDTDSLSFANVDPTTHDVNDCVPDPRFGSGFLPKAVIATVPAVPPSFSGPRLRIGVSSLPPIQTFGDGLLFTCTIQIDSGVSLGTNLTLTAVRAVVSDKDLNDLSPSTQLVNGTISAAEATPTNTPVNTPTPTVTPISCNIDTDCPPTQICLSQVCEQVGCTVNSDCPSPRICVEGNCAPPPCTTNADCPPQTICDQGACQVVPCSVETPCPDDNVCVDGNCVPPPTATPVNTPINTPTHTAVPPPSATATATNTVRPTATNTPVPTNTPTNTPLPTKTPTNTPGVIVGGSNGGGCNISPASTSGGSLLWLVIPAAAVLWRRRREG